MYKWAQFGGDMGNVFPHFFRRGDIKCYVLLTFFSLYLERFKK